MLWTKETDNLSISSCSENYIFGKFDAFCKRLEKINDMLNTMETFAGVNNIKIEVQCKQGHSSLNNLYLKPSDFRDHNKACFPNR